MYAIIETGGKQYRVSPGDTIQVETLAGDAGAEVVFEKVLAIGTDKGEILTGSEAASAKVKGAIAGNGRTPKVLVFKFKRKKQYKRTIGHRQNQTAVKINEIVA
jgi:large subunit ribosomal protein L21